MKKLLNFLPTHFTFFLIVGIVLQFYFKLWSFPYLQSIFFFTVFVLLLFVFWKKQAKQFFTFLSWLLFVLIGMFAVFSQDFSNRKNYYQHYYSSDSLVTIKIDKVLKSNLYYQKYVGEVVQVGCQKACGKLLINIQKDSVEKSISIGDFMYYKAPLSEVQKPLNPFQFNYKKYLEKQGIHQQLFLKNDAFIIQKSNQNSVYKIADAIRTKIEVSLIKNGFKGEELAVIKALILGQRNDISKELLEEYTNAGAIHILAVSGLHVGIILLILSFVFKPLERIKYGNVIKTILVVLLLWCFAIIAGLSASVVRAVTMFTAVAIGMMFYRKTLVLHSLMISMFVLLLFKPLFLFDVGFQLSYLAVFSIVTIQPRLYKLWNPKWWLTDKFWQLFTVSIAAQVGVLPVSLYYFHQFPSLFMLSNLVIIPFIGTILIFGIAVIFLALLNLPPSFLAEIYNGVIWLMNRFVGWVSLQESFLITEISFSVLLLIVTYGLILVTMIFFERKSYKTIIALLLMIVVFLMVIINEKREMQQQLELIVFNKSKQTIIGKNDGGALTLYSDLDSVNVKNQRLLKNYKIGKRVDEVKYIYQIPNLVKYQNDMIFVVDNIGVYNVQEAKSSIVLLRQSPKINLERLIVEINPKIIIADASNYKSQVVRWKFICDKKNIPFHYTVEDGAFVLN